MYNIKETIEESKFGLKNVNALGTFMNISVIRKCRFCFFFDKVRVNLIRLHYRPSWR